MSQTYFITMGNFSSFYEKFRVNHSARTNYLRKPLSPSSTAYAPSSRLPPICHAQPGQVLFKNIFPPSALLRRRPFDLGAAGMYRPGRKTGPRPSRRRERKADPARRRKTAGKQDDRHPQEAKTSKAPARPCPGQGPVVPLFVSMGKRHRPQNYAPLSLKSFTWPRKGGQGSPLR